jgi:hypothetical protein
MVEAEEEESISALGPLRVEPGSRSEVAMLLEVQMEQELKAERVKPGRTHRKLESSFE